MMWVTSGSGKWRGEDNDYADRRDVSVCGEEGGTDGDADETPVYSISCQLNAIHGRKLGTYTRERLSVEWLLCVWI